ncbi:MAG: SH3 domain-containing protein, partial [Proteobacteria bacterium]|nr:SH3 domain-containing protein [Pseudomonadota bacterium]
REVIAKPATGAITISSGLVEKKQRRHVPAGKIPPGVGFGAKVASRKCWNNSGIQYVAKDCGDMEGLLKLIEERLYLFDACRKDVVGKNLLGQLNLGIEFDFDRESISLWNIPSSTLRRAPEVVACIKSAIAGLSVAGLEPLFNRYQYTFSVLFEGTGRRTVAKSKQVASPGPGESVHPHKTVEFPLGRFGDGRFVMVNRDRVRIRVEPVDGHVLGKISSGSRVFLLDQQEEWCKVRTRRGNVGWMVCWALELK